MIKNLIISTILICGYATCCTFDSRGGGDDGNDPSKRFLLNTSSHYTEEMPNIPGTPSRGNDLEVPCAASLITIEEMSISDQSYMTPKTKKSWTPNMACPAAPERKVRETRRGLQHRATNLGAARRTLIFLEDDVRAITRNENTINHNSKGIKKEHANKKK